MKYSTAHEDLQKVFRFPSKEFIGCSIDNIEDYKKIVSGPAYNDFTPRTMPGIKKDNIKPALDWLAEELYTFIHSEDTDFEAWHNKTCLAFCEQIKELYGKIPYGKAQKIVNMSFKYLFILNDSQKYVAKFKNCHMALDQYTLEWFIRYVLTKEDRKDISVTKIRETSWSKLCCGDNREEEYSYLWLQDRICKYLNGENSPYITEEGTHLSPLVAEFYIWPEMQMHLAMEDLYAQGGKEKNFREKSISDKITNLREFLDELESQYNL